MFIEPSTTSHIRHVCRVAAHPSQRCRAAALSVINISFRVAILGPVLRISAHQDTSVEWLLTTASAAELAG